MKSSHIIMKSSHKENTDLYFIIQQLSLDKLLKCDCVGRKKKHDFGSFQKWQIWPNFTIEKCTQVAEKDNAVKFSWSVNINFEFLHPK